MDLVMGGSREMLPASVQMELFDEVVTGVTNEEASTPASEEQVQSITDQLMAQQDSIKPERAAELVFRYYFPQYQKLISFLGNKDARRLNESLVGYPLEIQNPKFHSDDAKKAFELAKILLDAKFVLQQKALSDKLQELETAEVGNTTEAINTEAQPAS